MTDRDRMKPGEARDESAEERRTRQSAREVAEWETALAAARKRDHSHGTADPDRANAGAVVSRAHRAEKSSGQSPGATRRGPTPTRSDR
jgi:hypothetical protein